MDISEDIQESRDSDKISSLEKGQNHLQNQGSEDSDDIRYKEWYS